MPLPNDEKILALSESILKQFAVLFGSHPGFRPAHAKGAILTGTFAPSAEAAAFCKAPHFMRPSTPVSVRFSNSTGVPMIPDNDPNANPRGMAIRFHLAERVHTDIVSHSTDGFPTRTGDEFLELLAAIAATKPDSPHPNPVETFLGDHPAALAFVQTPKPAPSSFARETYFGVTAMHFMAANGDTRFGRYQIYPEAGNDFVEEAELATRPANYLFDEITSRVATSPAIFKLKVQLADTGDVVDDATSHWPAQRTVLELGTLTLNGVSDGGAAEQQRIIFDPVPRVEGIEPSSDPLLELRAAIYLISGRARRTAPPTDAPA